MWISLWGWLAGCGGDDGTARVVATWAVYDDRGETDCPPDHVVEVEVAGVVERFACDAGEGVLDPVPIGLHQGRADLLDDRDAIVVTVFENLPELGPTGEASLFAAFTLPE